MKKYIIILAVTILCLFGNGIKSFAQGAPIWKNISRESLDLRTVVLDADNEKVIYIGSSRGIFQTKDGGVTWKKILSVKGKNRAVNLLLFGSPNKNYLYAATGGGLFYSHNQGESWNRIFHGKNYLENDCSCVLVLSNAIYLGTKGGLFVSRDKGRSWYKERGKLGNSGILAMAYNERVPDNIYIACIDGVFKTGNQGQSWERILAAHPVENGNEIDTEAEDEDKEAKFSGIRYISCDPHNLNCLYVATSRGVYRSCDKGSNWESISSYGLLSREVLFLLFSDKSNLYAITKSGVFAFELNQWKELSLGLETSGFRFLALDKQNNLYVACDRGLFKADMTYSKDDEAGNITSLYYKDEPKIKAVQQAAIQYAEVGIEKIKEWRKKAKMKAILPKLTVGLDRSEATNYEIYTSATTHYVYEGPDDKSNGWDVTLSWELGDLIWNEAQTSIDVRSRLLVQLRDDILDEVTRLYFERIRTKMELDNLSIEDRKKRLEKELRLQELTASLDALTGGYYSSQLAK